MAPGPASYLPLRLAAFSFSIFAVLGLFLPYWPVWLASRGWSPADIGLLMGANMWLRSLAGPLLAQVVDRTDRRRAAMVILAFVSVPVFALFALSDSFVAVLLIAAAFGTTHPPLMPLSDNMSMLSAARFGLVYGRIRLWGSLGFLAAASLGGLWFTDRDPADIYTALLLVLAISALTALVLPDIRVGRDSVRRRGRDAPIPRLLTDRGFLVFLATVGTIQASHAAYYAFSTLHWSSLGIDKGTIGALWAEGVVAEIVLFYFATARLTAIGCRNLFWIGAAGGAVRWLVLADAEDPATLFCTNWLHALSFGCTHLAAIRFVQRRVAAELSATAQSLTAAVSTGLFMAPAISLAGLLYEVSGATAFAMMALVSGLGGLLAVFLGRRGA